MSCENCQEQMMDVLYGEELRAGACFEFFQHLDRCSTCRQEYDELLETRNLLSSWTIEEEQFAGDLSVEGRHFSGFHRTSWWTGVLKVAATFLILVGAFSIVDRLGLAGSDRKMVSQTELMELVNDMIVVRQNEERKLIGQAMMEFADEMTRRQQIEMQRVSQDLQDLDRRYIQVMEDTSEYLSALATR